jgi:hypothetical protein
MRSEVEAAILAARAATGPLTTFGSAADANPARRSPCRSALASAIAQWYPQWYPQHSDWLGIRAENEKSPALAGLS